MLELLNQLDGFDSRGDVKVCGIDELKRPDKLQHHLVEPSTCIIKNNMQDYGYGHTVDISEVTN